MASAFDGMLRLTEIHTYYGESHILQGMDLHVEKGECVALLGPNGMGKTTTLRTIMGLTRARSGTVRFKHADITKWPTFRIARLGIGYVPEERGIFDTLTVIQNLKVPFLNLRRHDANKWCETEERVYTLFPLLRARQDQLAGTLSGGEQQMLATARGLISGEAMVILDEPTEGLAPMVAQCLVNSICKIKVDGHTILLVEQNIQTAVQAADRSYFLEKGRVRLAASGDIFRQEPELLQRYLGVGRDDRVTKDSE
jgi:branched-chain amino acid transport system ATP-binding protein